MRPPYDYGRDKQGKCLVCLSTGEHDQAAHDRRRLEDFPPAGEPTAQPEETSCSEIPQAIRMMMESHPESADQILSEYQAGTAGRRPVVDPPPLALFTPRETDLKPPRRVFGFPDED